MLVNELKNSNFRGNIFQDIPMEDKTAFKTGGKADYYIEPSDPDSLKALISILTRNNEEFIIIGGGTNTLVKDSGIKIVISLLKYFREFSVSSEDEKQIELKVQAGVNLQKLCWYCAKRGYTGLNPLIGIPGSFGGAVSMNAGTEHGDISSVVAKIRILDKKGKLTELGKDDLLFNYRSFSLKNHDFKNFIIIESLIRLPKGDKDSLYQEAKDLIIKRKKNQPVKAKSAGCFFKNPSPGVSAGMLIDKAGLKGKKIGGAKVSEHHANFITNFDSASSRDILDLKNFVQKEVKDKFHIDLEPEVKIVGK